MINYTKRWSILSIIAIAILSTVLIIYWNFYRINVQKVDGFKNIELPVTLKHMLIAGVHSSPWAVLKIDDRRIQYMYTDLRTESIDSILDRLQQIMRSNPQAIPHGIYAISLHDGIHKAYPWPLLGFASTTELVQRGNAVLIPDFEALLGYRELFKEVDLAIQQHPWDSKIDKIFWRGTATGGGPESNNFDSFPRISFLNYAQHLNYVDAGFTRHQKCFRKPFADQVAEKFPLKPLASKDESLAYKYLIDIDGISCSYSRMAWILYSNSLLLKHKTNKVQWYYDRLQPGVHYLSINNDFSNLHAQFMWAQQHQAEVVAMTQNARLLAQQVFSHAATNQALIDAFNRYHKLVAGRF